MVFEVSSVEASTGFEPVNKDFADPRLTTWPRRHGNNKDCKLDISSICNPVFERAMRFELTTFSLARRRSTTELRPHFLTHVQVESAETQDRTGDTAIFSRVLYQLSYLGQSILLLSVRDFTRTYRDCQETCFNLRHQFKIIQKLLDFLYPLRYNVRSLSN